MNPIQSTLSQRVQQVVMNTSVLDIHTHLYDPAFGELLLWGIDDLLVYHYLVAEGFRHLDMPYETFWSLSKVEQADLIWKTLFVEHSPMSEACRGVLTTLNALGLDPRKQDLPGVRKWFAEWAPDDYISRCMELAGVRAIWMTNSPFDDQERKVWERGFRRDDRFKAALRIDPLLLEWERSGRRMNEWGYGTSLDLGEKTFSEVRRFLGDWSQRINAQYLMVSLPPEFDFPDSSPCGQLLENAVLPFCRETGLPLALMPGVRRGVNPALRLAGDGVGTVRIEALANLFASHLDNQFLVTALPRESQYPLCVLARKFRNLHIFGCWWFTNIPLLIEEITRMRLELLGMSFTPQHSDARVLDQILYKWQHSRQVIAKVLTEQYLRLADAGWVPTGEEIERDVRQLFGGAFEEFCDRT